MGAVHDVFERLDAAGNLAEAIWPKVAANWLRRCHDWYAANPMRLSGTITTARALREIHIGQRLLEKRDEGNIEYYIEGVDNTWTFPNASRTQLTVTYGTYEGEDPLEYIYKQMEDPQSVRLADCASLDVIEAIVQRCRYEPHNASEGGELRLTHGGEGFEIGGSGAAPDESTLDTVGKSLLEEGASSFFGGTKPQSDPTMIPTPDIENDQAKQLANGNPFATVRKTPGSFGADQLRRNEDPLAGYDERDMSDDPIVGLTE